MTSPPLPENSCSVCGTVGSGRFCANCGSTLERTTCAACNASLSPGARFCHRCGKAIGATPPGFAAPVTTGLVPTPRTFASSLPWGVAAIALLALLAMAAGKYFNAARGSSLDAPQNALPQAGLDDRGATANTETGGGEQPAVRGPDISALSPQDRAERLFNRVMTLSGQGKTDSVLFFAPMAISAYEMLAPLNTDQRYDMGRIAEVAGALPLAHAQADTILQKNPDHLLGLILAARVAYLGGDSAAKKRFETRLLAAAKTETGKKLPEYELHQTDITTALADARRSTGAKQ